MQWTTWVNDNKSSTSIIANNVTLSLFLKGTPRFRRPAAGQATIARQSLQQVSQVQPASPATRRIDRLRDQQRDEARASERALGAVPIYSRCHHKANIMLIFKFERNPACLHPINFCLSDAYCNIVLVIRQIWKHLCQNMIADGWCCLKQWCKIKCTRG